MGDYMKTGYSVTYESNCTHQYRPKRRIVFFRVLTLLAAVLTVALLLIPSSGLWLRKALLPGDYEVTIQALDRFAQVLEGTGRLDDAVDAFCNTVIYGTQ